MTAPKCCKKGEIKYLGERTAVALERSCVVLALGADCGWPGQQPPFGGQGRQGGLKW